MRQEQSGRNSVQVGIHNRQLVLDVIRTNQPITRREIARLTGLTSAAVTNIVSNFIEQGFVREVGYGRSGGGRKPKLVELDKGSRIMVAVDLAGADQIAALLDMDGNVLCRGERRIGSAKGVTVADIVDAINEILDTPEARSGQVVGIGVTTPGLVDAATGTVLKSVALNWFNVPIKAALQKHFEYPVFIGKDTHVALLAEEWYGAAKNMQNAIYLWVGPGIAIGMLLDGRVYTGSTGMAGEFGHVSIDYDGPACKCGSWGCMEQMASLRAISSMAAKSDRDAEGYSGDPEERYIDPFNVLDAAEAGDANARRIVHRAGEYLGVGIANLINVFNPELIILGGQIRPSDTEFIEAARSFAMSRVLIEVGSAVTITASKFGRDAGLVGASALLWKEILRDLAESE